MLFSFFSPLPIFCLAIPNVGVRNGMFRYLGESMITDKRSTSAWQVRDGQSRRRGMGGGLAGYVRPETQESGE